LTILITGGAGVIGRELISSLSYNLVVFDLEIEKDFFDENVVSFSGDLRNKRDIEKIFKLYKFDGILHLGAISQVKIAEEQPELCFETNVQGSKNLIEVIQSLDYSPWVIFASSREVYGEQKRLPIKEDSILMPKNNYGKTKKIGEELFEELHCNHGNSLIVLRLSNVYGSTQDKKERVVPSFVHSILDNKDVEIHGGKQKLDFIHIEDVIVAFEKCIDKLAFKKDYYKTLNLSSNNSYSIEELLCKTEEVLAVKAKKNIVKDLGFTVGHYWGDNSLFKEEIYPLEFQSLNSGLKKYIERIKENS